MNSQKNICDFASMSEFLKAERMAERMKEQMRLRQECTEHLDGFIAFLESMNFPRETIQAALEEKIQ